jgi:hypothetical protein
MNPAAAGAEFAAMGQFAETVGNTVQGLAKQYQEIKGTEQYIKSLVESQKAMADLYDQTINSPEFIADPEAGKAKYQEAMGSLREQYRGQQVNGAFEARFQQTFENHALTHSLHIAHTTRQQTILNSLGTFGTAEQDMLNNALRSNSDLGIQQIRDDYDNMVDQYVSTGAIRADHAPKLKQAFGLKLNEGLFEKDMRDSGPDVAIGKLNSGGYTNLDETQRGRMLDKAEQRKDRLAAQAEADQRKYEAEQNRTARLLASKADDSIATMAEIGEEGPLDIEGRLRGLGTEQALDLADKYRDQKRVAMDTFKVVKGFDHMPLMDQADEVKRMFTVSPGESGAKERIHAGDMAERVVNERIKRFSADPVAYVQPMVEAIQMPGASQEERTAVSFSIQQEMAKGVPGFAPKIFGTDQAKNFGESWATMKPDERLGFTESLNGLGRYKGQAIAELGLGAGAQFAVAAHGADVKNIILARTLIQAADMKESDIPGTPAEKDAIKKSTNAALETNDVMKALITVGRYQPQNSSHLAFVSELQKGLVNTALASGDSKKAIEILNNTYDAVSQDNLAQIFYPKSSGLKPAQIESALDTIRKSKAAEWVKSGEPLLQGKILDERVRDLQQRGVWVNSPDGNGFVLLHPTTGLAVADSTGKPYKIDIDSLKKEYFEPRGKGYQMDLPVDDKRSMRRPISESMKLGALSARFESGDKGPAAVGYDEVGGTSYGRYQIASKTGTYDNFMGYLKDQAPDIHQRLSAAGQANTGGTSGSVPKEWQRIAKEQPDKFDQLQHDFMDKSHYTPAAEAVLKQTGYNVNDQPDAVKQVLWSTAAGHGPAGAAKIFGEAIAKVGTKDPVKLLQAIYDIRKTKYGSSTEAVRKSVQKRYDQESALAVANLMG